MDTEQVMESAGSDDRWQREEELRDQLDDVYALLDEKMEGLGKTPDEREGARRLMSGEADVVIEELIRVAQQDPLTYARRDNVPGMSLSLLGFRLFERMSDVLAGRGLLEDAGREGDRRMITPLPGTGEITSLGGLTSDQIVRGLLVEKDRRRNAQKIVADVADEFVEGKRRDTPPGGTRGPEGRGGRR